MYWEISLSAVTAYLGVTFTPWRRASDLVRRCISRVQRRSAALSEQLFGQKSDHIPQHKSEKG
jgi:hypothetical protein